MNDNSSEVIQATRASRATVKTGWWRTVYLDDNLISDSYTVLRVSSLKKASLDMLSRRWFTHEVSKERMRGILHRLFQVRLESLIVIDRVERTTGPGPENVLRCYGGGHVFEFDLNRLAYAVRVSKATDVKVLPFTGWRNAPSDQPLLSYAALIRDSEIVGFVSGLDSPVRGHKP